MSLLLVRALHCTIYGDSRTKYGVIQVLTVLSQGCTSKIQAWDGTDESWIQCELARMLVAVHVRRTCVVGMALGI